MPSAATRLLLKTLNLTGRGAVVYQLRDEFTTDASAPLTSPRTAEPGPGQLTFNDSGNQLSISGTKLLQNGTPGTNFINPRVVSTSSFTRTSGRALLTKININAPILLGWSNAAAADSGTALHTLFGSAALNVFANGGGSNINVASAITSATDYQIAIVVETTGAYYFIKGGSEYPAWTLLFYDAAYTTTPLYAYCSYSGAGTSRSLDYFRVTLLTGAFSTALGLATLNQASPVSGNSYTGDADGVYLMTVTADNPLLGTTAIGTEMRYRVQDASNYWTAYYREDGAFRVDSVAAGTPTNRINVAGVITNGATRTICIATNGTKHNAYTLSGNNWTKQGSEINVSHMDTQTTLQAQIGTNWAAANLRNFSRTSAVYNQLNNA